MAASGRVLPIVLDTELASAGFAAGAPKPPLNQCALAAHSVGWEHNAALRFPPVDKPERLIETTFNYIDAGCCYITLFRNGSVAAMDLDDAGKVTRAINGGENGLDERTIFTNRIRKVLL